MRNETKYGFPVGCHNCASCIHDRMPGRKESRSGNLMLQLSTLECLWSCDACRMWRGQPLTLRFLRHPEVVQISGLWEHFLGILLLAARKEQGTDSVWPFYVYGRQDIQDKTISKKVFVGEAGEILLLLIWSEEQYSDAYGESSVFGSSEKVLYAVWIITWGKIPATRRIQYATM